MMAGEMSAEALFEKYIFAGVKNVGDLSNKSLEETGLEDERLSDLKRTHFDDIYDTLLYSRLIERAIRMNPGIRTIIDLGAGSSIPTLLAMKNSGRTDLRTFAVDIDPEAHDVGSENARILDLHEKFVFYKGSMEEGLAELGPFGPDTLIVSNPPYIASPENLSERNFVPVNGGIFGDEYLLKILSAPYSQGATLALLWGSLTSPKRVLNLMVKEYQKLHMEAHRIHFGNYTTQEPLRTHLYRLRENGDVFFETNDNEGETQFVFGTILKKK